MKELFDRLPRWDLQADYVLDTCFLFYVFDKQLEHKLVKFCQDSIVAITSFTVQELIHHKKDASKLFKERFRHIVSDLRLYVIQMDVHPGEVVSEREFVNDFDPAILHLVRDPSDAVSLVVALQHGANIITRDKHHLFTTALENYLNEKGLRVLNTFPNE